MLISISKTRFILQTVVVIVVSLLLTYCGRNYPPSSQFPKRADNCQRCLPGEKCVRTDSSGKYKMCVIECGYASPTTRCPQGFYCAAGGEGNPIACVPIESGLKDITERFRPLCVLTDDGYIFWTRGQNLTGIKTSDKQWRIAEGCTTDIDESYTAVCAPGTEPAPVVYKVSCETNTSKKNQEEHQSNENAGTPPERILNTEEEKKDEAP